MKYRIIEKIVDGNQRFYAQYRMFLTFWITIKTEDQKFYSSDGGVQTKYAAEVRIKNHKAAQVGEITHLVQ